MKIPWPIQLWSGSKTRLSQQHVLLSNRMVGVTVYMFIHPQFSKTIFVFALIVQVLFLWHHFCD